MPTPQDVRKKGSKILKLPPVRNCFTLAMTNKFVVIIYEGRTESHEQPFFACKPGTADKGEYGGRWNQLLCYP